MSHARKQIRDAVKSLLDDGSYWKAVFGTRIAPTRQIWPFLMVFADGEPEVRTNIHSPSIYERDLSLAVVGMLKVSVDRQTVEDQIDEICVEIEERLTSAALRTKLSNYNVDLVLNGNTFTVIVDEEDNVSHAEILMAYTVQYLTTEGSPETLL